MFFKIYVSLVLFCFSNSSHVAKRMSQANIIHRAECVEKKQKKVVREGGGDAGRQRVMMRRGDGGGVRMFVRHTA